MHFYHRYPTIPQSTLLNHLKIWLRAYAESTSGVEIRVNAPVVFDDGSQNQVDALLRIREDAGGQSRIVADQVLGTPELIVEMLDRVSVGDALRKQRKEGIAEHIAVNKDGEPIWFSPGERSPYPDDDSLTAGTTFPGLKLNTSYFWYDDLEAQLSQLTEDLGSDEHQSFENRLEASG